MGCLNFFQSSSLLDIHMNTAINETVPYIARTLKGIGGYIRYLRYRRINAQKRIPCQNLGNATPMALIM